MNVLIVPSTVTIPIVPDDFEVSYKDIEIGNKVFVRHLKAWVDIDEFQYKWLKFRGKTKFTDFQLVVKPKVARLQA